MDLTLLSISIYLWTLMVVGYVLPLISKKSIARTLAWIIAVATVLVSTQYTLNQTPLMRMVIIVYLQLVSMKIIVTVETYSPENNLSVIQWKGFSLGWFGMRPELFEKLPSSPVPFGHLLLKGVSRIVIGFLMLYLSILSEGYSSLSKFFIPQLFLLVGLSLILHFGILNLSAAGWRALGVQAPELFRSPYKSNSLKEFWGRRWNLAFSEMTALIAYQPLREKIGIETAMVLSFLLSGLLHEIAISFPVQAGYGLPMLYFTIHALAMYLEKRSQFLQRIIRHRTLSHLWVMSVLIIPLPLLFHRTFIQDVLIPLRGALLQTVGM